MRKNFDVHRYLEGLGRTVTSRFIHQGTCSRLDLDIPSMKGTIKGVQIDNGIIVLLNNLALSESFSMPASSVKGSFLKINFYLKANYRMSDASANKEEEIETGNFRGLFYWEEQEPSAIHIHSRQRECHSVDMVIRMGYLRKLIREDIDERLKERITELLNHKENTAFRGRIPSVTYQTLKELWQSVEEGLTKKLLINSKVYTLLSDLLMSSDELLQNPVHENLLRKEDIEKLLHAREYLDGNFVNPPTLKELSRIVCLNEFKLKKGFRLCFNTTVHNYIIEKRLCTSCVLLKNKSCPVSQVAYEVGYQCTSKYISTFRRKYGVTPGAFRKSPVLASC